jgi:hypothetical protein
MPPREHHDDTHNADGAGGKVAKGVDNPRRCTPSSHDAMKVAPNTQQVADTQQVSEAQQVIEAQQVSEAQQVTDNQQKSSPHNGLRITRVSWLNRGHVSG